MATTTEVKSKKIMNNIIIFRFLTLLFMSYYFFCFIDATPNLRTTSTLESANGNRLLATATNITGIRRFDATKITDNEGFIPAFPMGAAGPSSLIAIGVRSIEARNKRGRRLWISPLLGFCVTANNPSGFQNNPKIVYDSFEDRFVVACTDTDYATYSNINIAVSKTSKPNSGTAADWYFFKINTLINVSGFLTASNHPGLEVDEEAVYIAANQVNFTAKTKEIIPAIQVRFWILDKGVKKGGLYSGGNANITASLVVRNSFGYFQQNYIPAEIRKINPNGAGPGLGTYLVSGGFSQFDTPESLEFVHIVRIRDPLGNPSYDEQFISLGDIEDITAPNNPVPQKGTNTTISPFDGRVYDVVWHDNFLWVVRTYSQRNTGLRKAYWIKLRTNTTDGSLAAVVDQGPINGTDVGGSLTSTLYPSLAVNKFGITAFGFTAISPTIYVGAYAAFRNDAVDTKSTVSPSIIVHEGVAPYKRYADGTRNSWGPWSGLSIDPVKEQCFWFFNMFADSIGSCPAGNGTFGLEDGCWGTGWARACVN